MSPSICGGFLQNKNSMVAFTWTLTTILTLFALLTAVVLVIQIHSHYRHMQRIYETDDYWNYYNYNNGDEEEEEHGSRDENERAQLQSSYLLLSTMSARSITFVAVYTTMLATALSLYGSMAIVGFTSLRGVYIAPCFSSGSDKMRVGIFGGAIVIFANLLLVCAVILGEVRVEDYRDNYNNNNNKDDRESEEKEPYQVERIATVLAVTCMFLSALYTIFAVLLFLCNASEEAHPEGVEDPSNSHSKPLVSVTAADGRPSLDGPGFITMDNSSQATS